MGPKRSAYKLIWIYNPVRMFDNVICSNGIHMVYYYTVMYLVAFYAKVAPIVTNDYRISHFLPFGSSVELLIEIPVKPESVSPDNPRKFKVFESFFKRWK